VSGTNRVRLGAVGYLNARPLVYGLDVAPRFDLRYDVPSECARLLHEGAIDVGLIPSIEYLRGGPYRIVPDLAIASRGPVTSVAIYTTRPIGDVRSIALDTSSRTSVALVSVLCARLFKIRPALESRGPDLSDMLHHCDAALLIGDNALLLDHENVHPPSPQNGYGGTAASPLTSSDRPAPSPEVRDRLAPSPTPRLEKIDLGEAWSTLTGLPFVWAFWAGRPEALDDDDVRTLLRARDAGMTCSDAIARQYFPDSPTHQAVGAAYLRDNIKYHLGDQERAGLELFYRYAVEVGVVDEALVPRFYGQPGIDVHS
jgi:chorismate dehydratase